MTNRKILLTFRTLTFWCLFTIPILLFWNWIWEHPQLIGYFSLPFVATALFFFNETLPIQLMSKEKVRTMKAVSALTQHIIYADGAISAGNVQQYLNCYIEYVHWVAFDKPTFTYLVIQLTVLSRFIYDLTFPDPEQVNITLIVKGATENDDIKITDKAILVESQSSWINIESPRRIDSTSTLRALWHNAKYFRFELKDVGTRDRIEALYKGTPEIQLELRLDWKLKVSHSDKDLSYYQELKTHCPMKWSG